MSILLLLLLLLFFFSSPSLKWNTWKDVHFYPYFHRNVREYCLAASERIYMMTNVCMVGFFFFFFHSQCRVLIILGHLVYYCWILNKRYACVSYVCLRFIVLKMDCVEIHRKSSSVQHSKTIQKIRLVWHTNRILLLSTLFFSTQIASHKYAKNEGERKKNQIFNMSVLLSSKP